MSNPIIEDSGTGYLKIGFAGDNFPSHSFPAMVGRPTLRADEQLDDANLKDIMIGDEAQPYRGLLELTHPLERRSCEKLGGYGINLGLWLQEIRH
ncbi:unnamed protein product (macronuclear) [Paramecium tetraurelia]|uniref:Uncharacterized protein n=1 Tax=Paramecium tetraurelia TaxID=5888 RepID=A0D9D5_PARTE|nr:uncharacterized protein GSPATT00014582001 [Paramecium tetraurelia]CAK79652.1 unnamed protein product [Paramecium tetraurelia]|eukprot:XP_001447049.1 hypothetical protein (macronuclear) [Paramecium tetraurelia strain d4-2]